MINGNPGNFSTFEAGRVRAVGSHEELLARDELYADLGAALRIAPALVG